MLGILRGLASSVECRHGHAVYLNVVRMAIAALLIIAGDDVRTEFPDEVHQASRGLVEVRLGQAVRMVIGFPSHHPRVTVAEDMQLLDLQMFARALEFRGAHVPSFGFTSSGFMSGSTTSPSSPRVAVTSTVRIPSRT